MTKTNDLLLSLQREIHPNWLYVFFVPRYQLDSVHITHLFRYEGTSTLIIVRPLTGNNVNEQIITILRAVYYAEESKVELAIYQANSLQAFKQITNYISGGVFTAPEIVEVLRDFHHSGDKYSLEYVEDLLLTKLAEDISKELLVYSTKEYIPICSPDRDFSIGIKAPPEKAQLIIPLLTNAMNLVEAEVNKAFSQSTSLTPSSPIKSLSDIYSNWSDTEYPTIRQTIQLAFSYENFCELAVYFSLELDPPTDPNEELPINRLSRGVAYQTSAYEYNFKTGETYLENLAVTNSKVNVISRFWARILSCMYPFVIFQLAHYRNDKSFSSQLLYATDDLILVNRICLSELEKNTFISTVNLLNLFIHYQNIKLKEESFPSLEERRETLFRLYQELTGKTDLRDLLFGQLNNKQDDETYHASN